MTERAQSQFDEQVERIFHEAIELPTEEREAYVIHSCGGDAALCDEVLSLLRRVDVADSFLERPAQFPPTEPFDEFSRTADGEARADAARAASAHMPERIGRYRVIRLIGAGGMGEVYLAEQDQPRREVAVKVIRAGVASPEALRRFEHEARILGRLHHPGIAQVFDAGRFGAGATTRPFFAMEFIQGKPLQTYVADSRPSLENRLRLFIEICDAVSHAHIKGVVHRDLKPANVIVDDGGRPKVLDFGVARVTDEDIQATTMSTRAGQLVGTLPYMSPEQVEGDPDAIDTRSDIYSLGVVLFELLTERLPYELEKRSALEAARVIRENEPTRLSSIDRNFRGDLETIALKALEKDRERRYQSVAEFADDVRRHLRDEPIMARPPSATYLARKFARRNRAVVVGALLVILVLLAGVGATTLQAIRATDAEREAQSRAVEAERSAATARAVSDFLQNDIIAIASPELAPGEDLTVREALDRASRRIDGAAIEDPSIAASIHEAIGSAFFALEEFEDARTHLQTVLELLGDRADLETSIRVQTLIASSAVHLGDVDHGRREYERLIRKAVPQMPSDSQAKWLVYSGYASFASVFDLPLEESVEYAKAAYEGRRRLLGAEHNDTLISAFVFGDLLLQRGDTNASIELLQETLQVRERVHGRLHPWTIGVVSALARAHNAAGQFDAAESLWRDAIERAEAVFDAGQAPTLEPARDLASMLRRTGRLDEALELLEGLEPAVAVRYGDAGLPTLNTRNDLALALSAAGRHEEAIEILGQVIEGYTEVYGPDHRFTFIARANQVDIIFRSGRVEDAVVKSKALTQEMLLALDPGSEIVLKARESLAYLLWASGDLEANLAELQSYLPDMEEAYGPDHSWTRTSLAYICGASLQSGQTELAIGTARTLLERCQSAEDATDAETLRAHLMLAGALRENGDVAESIGEYAACREMALATTPPGDTLRDAAIRRSTEALAEAGRFAEASEIAISEFEALEAANADATPMALLAADLFDQWHTVEPDMEHQTAAALWRQRAERSNAENESGQ